MARSMTGVAGWDIGGAHLKLARVEGETVVSATHLPCALWRGLDELRHALATALASTEPVERHAVTMTGELADVFPDRAAGVAAILDVLAEFLPLSTVAAYTTKGAFLPAERAKSDPDLVASANWHATSHYLAPRLHDGILVDIGSTTTDIVPFTGGRVGARGATDVERLATGGAASETPWRGLAEAFVRRQTATIELAIDRVLSGSELPADAPVVGAGIGRFLAEELARRFRRPYRNFGDTIAAASPRLRSLASDIAPAAAVALLLSSA
jgi:uncharacterized hydantoinase/oxoprolinase family protein